MAHDDDRRGSCSHSDSTPTSQSSPHHAAPRANSQQALARDSASRLTLSGHAVDISPWAQIPRDLDQGETPPRHEPFDQRWLHSRMGSPVVVGGMASAIAIASIVLTTGRTTYDERGMHSEYAPTPVVVGAHGSDPGRPSQLGMATTRLQDPEGDFTTEELGAMNAYSSACDVGEPSSCIRLGVLYANRRNTPDHKYLPVAAWLFEKACETGDPIGCNNLGIMYLDPIGAFDDDATTGNILKNTSQQAGKAIPLFEQACNWGNADGCNNLGAMHEHGAVVPTDLQEAQRLYKKACDGGLTLGCANLASLYAKNPTLGAPSAETERLFLLACEAGNTRACVNLAEYTPAAAGR